MEPKPAKKKFNMPAELMNSVHTTITKGMDKGWKADKIAASLPRTITKAHLVKVIMELTERGL